MMVQTTYYGRLLGIARTAYTSNTPNSKIADCQTTGICSPFSFFSAITEGLLSQLITTAEVSHFKHQCSHSSASRLSIWATEGWAHFLLHASSTHRDGDIRADCIRDSSYFWKIRCFPSENGKFCIICKLSTWKLAMENQVSGPLFPQGLHYQTSFLWRKTRTYSALKHPTRQK